MPSGGYRVGAGRPKKSAAEKKLAGTAAKSDKSSANEKLAPLPSQTESIEMMNEYFAAALKECVNEVPSVDALRGEIERYIASQGCEGLVAPQIITDYVIHRQGFLACECMNRKLGRMTKDYKLSPYVTAGQAYNKTMREDFNQIMQIILRHGGEQGEEKNEFLKLLQNRGF